MNTLHRTLAGIICVLVALQAASHAWASAGIGAFVVGGGVIDASLLGATGGPPPFVEVYGLAAHSISGSFVIPIVGIALLLTSFLTHDRGAVMWSALVLAAIALQVTLGYTAHGLAALALIHGFNALVVFSLAGFLVLRHPDRGLQDSRMDAAPATVRLG
ncbi:hypothetical protein [Propioniciclava coleopterorum]|uniref:hypothetical protein n=1 Tax=Propioniciclava coleopterorum TaxID=2714937 RepID=UPI0019824A7F|nr:hypothetical protein [Propioniciclava coleopterorum]